VTQLKTTAITPLPKVSKPSLTSDYRPISITPILSRIGYRSIYPHYLGSTVL